MTDTTDHAFLKRAVDLSYDHMRSGEGKPFGAVVVLDGRNVGEGWNAIFAQKDPTAHAELMAIRRALKATGRSDLDGAVLYASGEPCPMCLGAMYFTKVSRCVYATTRSEATRIGNITEAVYEEYPLPPAQRSLPCIHQPMPEASAAFDEWLARAR